MTIRKRRQPSPAFRLPPPYQPITGERAPLMVQGIHPHCAMMQVAAEDTHDNYVVCRGFDTRVRKFFDYDEEDLENKPGIPVAKPYGKRGQTAYQVGQVFSAVLPLSRIGQNPGVAAESTGHPADLDEEVVILYDEDEHVINWLLLDSGGGAVRHYELKDDHAPGTTTTAHPQDWSGSAWVTDTDADAEFDVTDPLSKFRGRGKDKYSSPHDTGSEGTAERNSESGEWEIQSMTPTALEIRGQATADWTASTFTIDGVAVMQPIGGIITDQDPAGNITVTDHFNWDGSENDDVFAQWDESADLWRAYQISCP